MAERWICVSEAKQTAKPHCVNYVNWSLGTLMGLGGKWANTKALGRACGPAARVQRQIGTKSQKWKEKSLSLTLGDKE